MLQKQLATLKPQDKKAVENFIAKTIEKMEQENKSLQEVLQVSDETLEKIYVSAYTFYNQGLYEKACQQFQLLTSMTPKNPKFLFGLASCFFQLEDYSRAASLFIATLYQDSTNAEASYFAADCFIRRGENEAALECLNLAIAIAEEDEKYASLLEKYKLIKNTLELKK